jgi:cell division protease FtsH
MEDIDAAIDRIIAGLEKRNRLINPREREIVAYHEAGHAIVAERVDTADPVHKISIIPRGVAALGYTQQLPTDDRYIMQRRELDDRITVLLGGRAAEELIFDELSSGAGNDLERATDIARRMVAELGMSETLGPVTFARRRSPFLNLPEPMMDSREYSDDTARTIDEEVRRMLTEGYLRALEILRRDREHLEEVARRLLENEVMDRDELRTILGRAASQPGDAERPEVGHVPQAAD